MKYYKEKMEIDKKQITEILKNQNTFFQLL